MKNITLEELLEAGCHFGHQVTRHNPKSRDFVFEARDNIHIIDLAKTKQGLEEAGEFVKSLAAKGNTTLVMVATKRQAKGIVEEAIKRAAAEGVEGLYFVTSRWIGGTLTNFAEVAKNSKKLKDLEDKLRNDEEKEKYTKKEVGMWDKERGKLQVLYGGIKDMKARPDGLFIVDSHLENLAVRESLATHVPTAAIVDTNADPLVIDYPIPANDDAVGSIKIITDYIVEAWIEGKKEGKKIQEKAAEDAAATEAKNKAAADKKVADDKKEAEAKVKKEAKKKPAKKATKKEEVTEA